jgi:serine/threonine protein kinase
MGAGQVKEELGRGGNGVVYRIASPNPAWGSYVALKEITTSGMKPKHFDQVAKECDILSNLSHPNVVSNFYNYLKKDKLCIIMEMCNGDLAKELKFLQSRPDIIFSEKYMWRTLAQIADAIAYLHTNGIIHRDMKPGNILIGQDGRLKVSDFGWSRFIDEDSFAMTRGGTPLYNSPEIIKNRPYTQKADVWGLGCIMYEMANAGIRPFPDPVAVCTKTPKPLPSHYSKELRGLINKMLAKSENSRPDIFQVVEAVRKQMTAKGISRIENSKEDPFDFYEKHPAWVAPLTPKGITKSKFAGKGSFSHEDDSEGEYEEELHEDEHDDFPEDEEEIVYEDEDFYAHSQSFSKSAELVPHTYTY